MDDAISDPTDDSAMDTVATPIVTDPLTPERVADRLLSALHVSSPQSVFDWQDTETDDSQQSQANLSARKSAADLLVKAKHAKFADDTRTALDITNAGRYWALHGGYLAFLKEEPPSGAGGGGRQRNPEMETLRAEYMKLRLGTFWWSFGLSIAGFVMSIISVAIALFYGDRLLR